MDSERVRPKHTPKSSPRPFFYRKTAKLTPKATPKGTLKSIKNHKKSDFGLRLSPEAPQDHPRTPKVCKKRPKVTPNGTQNDEKVMPKTKKEERRRTNTKQNENEEETEPQWVPETMKK